MTSRLEQMLTYYVVNKEHHQFRKEKEDAYRYARQYAAQNLSDYERAVQRLKDMLQEETPVVFPDEKIVLLRTVPVVPEIFTEEETAELKKKYYFHEQGKVCNINVSYDQLMAKGFTKQKEEIKSYIEVFEQAQEPEKVQYEKGLLEVLEAVESFVERYRSEAIRVGNLEAAQVFANIPANPPKNFQEALQFLRLLQYCLWCSFNYHNTLGRFDQYMYSYYEADIREGRLTKEEALELLEEFFLSLNKDSDLYTGMQQGDNGQSLVLGGLNEDGSDSYNDLSDLCLQASLELKLIDPKINLRVSKKTPLARYVRGTELTRQGLGFPQYCNDDVVIPALLNWGYERKDAYNYCVAACWEFIIPGVGMDIPNVNGLSFCEAMEQAVSRLESINTFEDLMEEVKKEIYRQAEKIMDSAKNLYMEPAPFMSLMMQKCAKSARDISKGNKYNNFGIHGTGLSTAVDSLAAVRKYVFEDKVLSKKELIDCLEQNFEGQELICNMLRYEGPKMGNDDEKTDDLAVRMLDWFSDALEGHKNERGGIYRAGTGSAMYYIWHSKGMKATPDGRRAGEEIACNYSPSLLARCEGPISILKSFSRPHLQRVANGGPLTIELHDNMFRNEESTMKAAMFVKSFMDMGGHQMQINAVNRDTLIDAKKHPEKHRNLIVRVWGWSGYFVELDECYQDHILKRMEISL